MRFLLLVGLTIVAAATAFDKPNILGGYHEAFGIPTALKIKAAEEAILAGQEAGAEGRIVGGSIAPDNAYPFMAGQVINFAHITGVSFCGSTLLTSNRLVTAAHCWFDGNNQASLFTVVLGSQFLFFGGTRIPTTHIVMHPQWTTSTLANDIAMIYLPSSVQFSPSIQPIAIPSGVQLQDTFAGLWSTAIGYGQTHTSIPVTTDTQRRHVNLQVITVAACQAHFGQWALNSNICTSGLGGVGICFGDSGGPLMITLNGQRLLVGVSSYVSSLGCEAGFPSAFARITSFNGFIQQHLF